MSLWYPPNVMQEMVADRRRQATVLAKETAEASALIAEWNRILQGVDPHLQLVKAPERTNHHQLRGGFYHIIRTPPPQQGQPMIQVIEHPDGSFREPNSSDLEALRAGDMWNDRARKEMARRERAAQKAAEAQRAQEANDRQEEFMDRYRHHFVTKIPVSRGLR